MQPLLDWPKTARTFATKSLNASRLFFYATVIRAHFPWQPKSAYCSLTPPAMQLARFRITALIVVHCGCLRYQNSVVPFAVLGT